ncbi:hypothetical protein M8J75_003761 [Diaphorina citri]|nr:hypothetical protein M8J75_003761 [Diaphorina citri]
MNSLAVVISALLAVAAAETVLQKNHPNGAWELQLRSDENQYYQQQPQFAPIPIVYRPQPVAPAPAAFVLQSDEILTPRKYIPIVSQSEIHHPDGGYQLSYQSADGQAYSEQGNLKPNFENDGKVVVRSGNYAYTAPDGTPIALTWVADEYGFKATGSHLPKAPSAQ